MLAVSIVLIALGLLLYVKVKLVPMPTEGLVLAIMQVAKGSKFHIVKIIKDCILVALALTLSIVFLGELRAIREGTILSAVFVGKVMPYVERVISPVLLRFRVME